MQQGGFTCTIAANYTDAICSEQVIRKIGDDGSIIVFLSYVIQLDNFSAQSAGGGGDFDGVVGFGCVSV